MHDEATNAAFPSRKAAPRETRWGITMGNPLSSADSFAFLICLGLKHAQALVA
jgi:hypothetical protein